jgi:hypothetical protein
MRRLTKGTVEYLIVDLHDELEEVDTLIGTGLKYDVKNRDGTDIDGNVFNQLSGTVDVTFPMQARCLIDTTPATILEAQYQLFINFDAFAESPRLGPFEFQVSLDG